MTMRHVVAGTLTALLTHRSYTALAQSQSPSPALGSCNVSCVSNRDCTPPRDARSCETSIAGLFKRLDPVCEAAKAAQNQIYDSQRVACESSKAAERAQCEAREQFCFSVAKVCSDDREKAAASNIEGTLVLW